MNKMQYKVFECLSDHYPGRVLSRSYSRPLWNLEPALYRGPRQAAFQPARDVAKAVERDQLTCAVKADQIAHSAEHRNVGDGVVVVHDPLPSRQTDLHHTQQAL